MGQQDWLLPSIKAAVAACDPAILVARALDPAVPTPVVFAFGKAAFAMARGALSVFPTATGIAVGCGRREQMGNLIVHLGDHPTPTSRSVEHGETMLALAEQMSPQTRALCLVSGGGSSMVEALRPGVDLSSLVALTTSALRGGVPIEELNREREAKSRFKGGGLLRALRKRDGARDVRTLVMSDVPKGRLDLVASGPTRGNGHRLQKVGDNQGMQRAIGEQLKLRGFEVEFAEAELFGEARTAALPFLNEARSRAQGRVGFVYVGGGETTVTVNGSGIGGRNQEFVLAMSKELRHGELVFSFATDGADGPSGSAGAWLTHNASERACAAGMDPQDLLKQNDADRFFRASKTRIRAFDTGTNVRDVCAYVRVPSAAS